MKRSMQVVLILLVAAFVVVQSRQIAAAGYATPISFNNTTLYWGDYAISPLGHTTLTPNDTYNILYLDNDSNGTEWTSAIDGSYAGYGSHTSQTSFPDIHGDYLVFQSDENLVLYSSGNAALWATNSNGSGASTFNLQEDGNMVLRTSGGTPVWSVW